MEEDPNQVKPTIDDQFWFDRSAEFVKESNKRLNEWSDRVRDTVLWAFGLYSVGSVLTVEYKKINNPVLLVIFILPYFLAIYAYWLSQKSQVPITLEFHPRAPEKIEQAYKEAYKQKAEKAEELAKSASAALVSISVALAVAVFVKNEQRSGTASLPAGNFSGKVEKRDDHLWLVVTGTFPPDTLLHITAQNRYLDDNLKIKSATDSTFSVLTPSNGILQQTFRTDTAANEILFRVSWSDINHQRSAERIFSGTVKSKKKK